MTRSTAATRGAWPQHGFFVTLFRFHFPSVRAAAVLAAARRGFPLADFFRQPDVLFLVFRTNHSVAARRSGSEFLWRHDRRASRRPHSARRSCRTERRASVLVQ